jgi:signal transduction histidine kinase
VALRDLAAVEAFVAFLATALAASLLASRLRRQAQEAARLANEREALRHIASLVARETPPTDVFAAIAEQAGFLLGVDLAVFARQDPDGSSTVLAVWGEPEGIVAGQAGVEPNDATIRTTGFGTGIVSPIVVEGRQWGCILVATRSAEMSGTATERMTDFSELLATAIRNTENQAQLRASRARVVAAADETRRKIERDLHDGAQQRLVSLGLSVRAVEAALPSESDEIRTELSRVADGLVSVLDELREMSRGLHPAILTEGGLQPALKALARRSPVAVELDVDMAQRLPHQTEVTAYYVVSELLANAAKHAHASAVQVAVHAPEKMLMLSVEDDGTGGADPARGSGLIGLRDRVEAVGGTIAIRSVPGTGTCVDVAIPIAAVTGASS